MLGCQLNRHRPLRWMKLEPWGQISRFRWVPSRRNCVGSIYNLPPNDSGSCFTDLWSDGEPTHDVKFGTFGLPTGQSDVLTAANPRRMVE